MDLIWWIVILACAILPAIGWGLWYTFRGSKGTADDSVADSEERPG